MSTINIPGGTVVTEGVILDEFGESLRVAGQLVTAGTQPAVLTQNTFNQIDVRNSGLINSENTAIQVTGIASVINNNGTINGGFNGINIVNASVASARINNTGLITSASRAINIGSTGGILINRGLITTTADPRNGAIYGDFTADNVIIENRTNGVIEVGAGLNGDAISLELGAQVNGSIINRGLIQGRGLPDGAPNNQTNQAAAIRLYWVPESGSHTSIFNGNIENSGTLAAENGAAVIIERYTQLNGSIINRGVIESTNLSNGTGILLVDGSEVTGRIVNSGIINGGRDGVNFANGGQVNGVLYNTGIILSTSRAVNIAGNQVRVINNGLIATTAEPRNGTIYGDVTARNIFIENRANGIIEVDTGLNGDAISLELGAQVNGSIINRGLIQGRGLPDGAPNNQTNQAAAIRLYWVPESGSHTSIFNGNIENSGTLAAENGAAVIIERYTQLNGSIINRGVIESTNLSNGTGILLVDGSEVTGRIVNSGIINGGRDGVNFANGGQVNGVLYNTRNGVITSTSRAVNIAGNQVRVINNGLITTTAEPRNGTIYGDVTARNVFIENRTNGVIEVGEGLNGDAISLELGAQVNGSIINRGVIQGRGLPDGAPNNQTNQAAAIRLYWVPESGSHTSIFNGNIENSGTLAAENGAAVIIERYTQLNGSILNSGVINGGLTDNGQLAIAASEAVGSVTVRNRGTINGDILLSANNDTYNGQGGSVNGTVYGGDGNDTLIGGNQRDIFVAGAGNDSLYGNGGNDLLDGGAGSDILRGDGGADTFRFAGDIFQDGLRDLDTIVSFQSGDTFDFSQYFQVGGSVSFIRNQQDLLVNLSNEDFVVVRGNINAAEQQLSALFAG
ncbi:hypothetical protein LC593_16360 [Nostoc sp. CHAB 5844]|nr:hypothetical protein [Nostoc sp. CHAB 5844]